MAREEYGPTGRRKNRSSFRCRDRTEFAGEQSHLIQPRGQRGPPTIYDQIDKAQRFYSDPTRVDLILLSGCGNDVGVQKLLDASSVGEVDEMTQAKCGTPMENLLRRIAKTFPSAHVIVIGYVGLQSVAIPNDSRVSLFR